MVRRQPSSARLGLPRVPLARLLASAVVGVAPEFMGIGPAPAIRLLLHRSGLSLDDIGRFEINEAQAAQVLAVAQELELDSARLNVQGGSLAVGHPLAATGLRLVMTLAGNYAGTTCATGLPLRVSAVGRAWRC